MTTTLSREIAIAIGARVRELRLERGLSQRDMERLVGSDRAIVARVERGLHAPDPALVARYAAALGVPLFDVVCVLDDVTDVCIGPLAGRAEIPPPSAPTRVVRRGAAMREVAARRVLSGWLRRTRRRAA
jgi:transcriptional regulator with XRE-family HTH domain